MGRSGYRRLVGSALPALWGLSCLLAAGCASIDPTLGTPPQPPRAGVSFESIDGPPEGIARSLLASLEAEAAARRIAVLPAGNAAAYRIRGYLAVHPKGGAATISWVWDVYDAELNRAFRLGGEERAAERKGWAAADDATLRRLAHAGIEELAALISAPPAAAGAPSPEVSGSVVATR